VKYKRIIISDLHLGIKDSKSKQLLKFLNKNSCEELILNGDIIDGWALKRGSTW
jgi:UDP-2,3-diacylglucosamine pyrophosphatase LpxH